MENHSKLGMVALAHTQPSNEFKSESYSALMHDMCMKYNVENPAELSCSSGLEFYKELRRRWDLVKHNA